MVQNPNMPPFVATNVPAGRMDTVRAVVYARQSKARQDASEASPESQISNGTALATARGWTVTAAYSDVGRSGWDPNVIRPEYEAMMDAVRAGEVDVVVINELSRLTRKGAYDAMTIDRELKAHAVRLVSVQEPFLDTSNPVGEAIFALIAALAKQDSDIKSARISGAKEAIRAKGGRPDASPPYGMRATRTQAGNVVITTLEPDPDFSPIVERLIELAMAGHTYNQMAAAMNADGIPAPGLRLGEARIKALRAKRSPNNQDDARPVVWRAQSVRGILTHPVIGGFASERQPRGPKGTLYNVIARDASGSPLEPHEGIVSGAAFLALQDVLSGRKMANRKPATATPSLLTGWRFFTCGLCSGAMGRTGAGYYNCSNPVGHGGLSVQSRQADDYVPRRVWAKLTNADLDDPDDREWLAAASLRFAAQQDTSGIAEEQREAQAHLEHVKSSIRELQADRQAGLYQGSDELATWRATLTQYREYQTKCEQRIQALARALDGSISLPAEWIEPGTDPLGEDSVWAAWDVYEKRAFLDLFLTGVSAGPGRGPDHKPLAIEDRIRLMWRESPSAPA